MTFDEMERAMQFLLAQRAQFAADLQQSREISDRRHGQVTEALLGLTAIAGGLFKADERLGQRLDARDQRFTERLQALDERLEASDQRFADRLHQLEDLLAALAAAQRETEVSLNALMRIVDRHVGDRPRPPPPEH